MAEINRFYSDAELKKIENYQNVIWVNKFSKGLLVEQIFDIRKRGIRLELLIVLNEQSLQEVDEILEMIHISNNIGENFYNYQSPMVDNSLTFNSCGVDIKIITCDTYEENN